MEFTILGQRIYKGLRFENLNKDFLDKGILYDSKDGDKSLNFYRTEVFGVSAHIRLNFENDVLKDFTIFDSSDNAGKDIVKAHIRIMKECFGIGENEMTEDDIISCYDRDGTVIRDFSLGKTEFYIRVTFTVGDPMDHIEENTETSCSVKDSMKTYERNGLQMKEYIEYTEVSADISRFEETEIKQTFNFFRDCISRSWLDVTVSAATMTFMLKRLDIGHLNKLVFESDLSPEMKKLILHTLCGVHDYVFEDGRRLYAGYKVDRITADSIERDKAARDMFYIEKDKDSIQSNDFPKQFTNKIICDDCLNILKQIPDNSVDIILTAPPTDLSFDYDIYSDCRSWKKYLNAMVGVINECCRVIKYGGRIMFLLKPNYEINLPLHSYFTTVFIEQNMIWKGEIIWNRGKKGYAKSETSRRLGPENPILRYNTEYLEIFCKGRARKYGSKDRIDIWDFQQYDWVHAQWEIPAGGNSRKYGHPDVFPEELAERALRLFSYKGDIVLDPFNGIGTTTAVAKRLDRKYLGIDISGEYCTTAQERLEKIRK